MGLGNWIEGAGKGAAEDDIWDATRLTRISKLFENRKTIPQRGMLLDRIAHVKALNQDQAWLGAGEV